MDNCHTLVVGGTRGIGLVFARLMAQAGHQVSVIGRHLPADHAADVDSIRYWLVDLRDEPRLLTVLADIVAQAGKLTHLAFFQRFHGAEEKWQGEWQVSLTATKIIVERLASEFDGCSENSIVMAVSQSQAFVADEQPLSYHVGKAGLNQMLRYYAVMLGPQGIRVNGVSTGAVLKAESRDFYLQNKDLLDFYETITPLKRMGTAEEIAQVAAFLCSSQASFITGQNIVVDGGISLRAHETLARRVSPFRHLKVTRADPKPD